MFTRPIGRIVWPILWAFVAPMLGVLLLQVGIAVLPVPHTAWGLGLALVIVALLGSLPALALRRSMQEDHIAGAVVSAICLGWVVLAAFALVGLVAFRTGGEAASMTPL